MKKLLQKEALKEIRLISINICDLVIDDSKDDADVPELLEMLKSRIDSVIKLMKR